MNPNVFSSKILLFGEYGVIKGSKGFAFPLREFSGTLKMSTSINLEESLRLDEFATFLKNSMTLSKELNTDNLIDDINSGLFFDSKIPIGKGIGSSGALCAAIFSKYSRTFERKEFYSVNELKYLQDMMALMESFYHGTSSGVDSLISLINLPVIIKSRNNLETTNMPNLEKFGHFYLIDSEITRKTSPLVHKFLSRYDSDMDFKKEIKRFIELNDSTIDSMINNDIDGFKDSFKSISKLQYVNFSRMIPQNIKKIWLDGLDSKNFYLKLCGAGGGGFFLIYSDSNNLNINENLIKLS